MTAATEPVYVLPTGTCNLASMLAALERAGARPVVVTRPADVTGAARLVVPGVGAFAAARASLVAAGLWAPLGERLRRGDRTLLVCLGMQLLCAASEESPGAPGLGLVDATVRRLPADVRVPQLGWTEVDPDPACRLVAGGHAYFAHGYALTDPPPGFAAAHAFHGRPFVAAIERGGLLACQFHPELSGAWGHALLRRWLDDAPRHAGPGPTARVIPCLDIKDGRVIKGVRFHGLRDAGSPIERAAVYEAQGADELVILDVSATPEARTTAVEVVRSIRARLGIPLTVGGGVRGLDDVGRLLDAGADKVAINTAAVVEPALLDAMAARFGRQCVVVAIDAAARTGEAGWEVVVRSGKQRTGLDAVAWARAAERRGAGEVLLTSFDRDGTRSGYDLALVAAVSAATRVPVIASGGASTSEHLRAALAAGADAVLAASIFHDDETTVGEVKADLQRAGVRVRR